MIKYKDTLFRSTFKEPREAIKLYNVINNCSYDINTPIEVNVLNEMMFSDKENDVSFILEDRLVIFIEHQSTINYNMPLRFLEYLSANYRYIRGKRKYAKGLIRLPKPEFYVLYNGRDKWDREYLKLSDAFEVSDNADTYVELVAKIIDIKPENAVIDIKSDNELYVYSVFVSRVQSCLDEGSSIYTALKDAREYCLQQRLSSSILDRWGEVSDMLLEEFSLYDNVRLESEARGEARGEQKGMLRGKAEFAANLLRLGIDLEKIKEASGLSEDMLRAIQV